MTTESEVKTVTSIKFDSEDRQVINNAVDLLMFISREMCGMHATEIKMISAQASKEDDFLDVEELSEVIRTLREFHDCLSIKMESNYYEGFE